MLSVTCIVFLTVTFAQKPVKVTVTVKDTAVLPCTGATYRDSPAHHQQIQWRKTESQLVAHWSQRKFTPGPGYEGRVELSKEGIKNGNFSLTISPAEYSDRGSYDCFREFKTLSVVNLEVSVCQSSIITWPSESLHLPLYTREPVRFLFGSGGSNSKSVCSVEGDALDCGPQYQHRASVQNSTLMLKGVTPADSGVYRVMDHKTNNTINIVALSVTALSSGAVGFLSILHVLSTLLLYVY
ncbi:uncharacterized protein LOC108927180 [Arapaima gigas]